MTTLRSAGRAEGGRGHTEMGHGARGRRVGTGEKEHSVGRAISAIESRVIRLRPIEHVNIGRFPATVFTLLPESVTLLMKLTDPLLPAATGRSISTATSRFLATV